MSSRGTRQTRADSDEDRLLSRRSARSRTPAKGKSANSNRPTLDGRDDDDSTEEITTNKMPLRSGREKLNKLLIHHGRASGDDSEEFSAVAPAKTTNSRKKQPSNDLQDILASSSDADVVNFRVNYAQTPHRQPAPPNLAPQRNSIKFGVNNYPDVTSSSELSDGTDFLPPPNVLRKSAQLNDQIAKNNNRCDFPKCTVFWIIVVLFANLIVLGWFAFHNRPESSNQLTQQHFSFDNFHSLFLSISGTIISLFKTPQKQTLFSINDHIQTSYPPTLLDAISPTSGNPLSYYFINPHTLTSDQFNAIYPSSILPSKQTLINDQKWLYSALKLPIPTSKSPPSSSSSSVDLISLYQQQSHSPQNVERLINLVATNNQLSQYHTAQLVKSFTTYHSMSSAELLQLQNDKNKLQAELTMALAKTCPTCPICPVAVEKTCPLQPKCPEPTVCEVCKVCENKEQCQTCPVCDKPDYSSRDVQITSLTAKLVAKESELDVANAKFKTCQADLKTKSASDGQASANANELQAQLSELKISNAELQSKLDSAKKQIVEKIAQNDQCTTDLQSATTLLQSATDECENDLDSAEKLQTELQQQLAAAQHELKSTQDKLLTTEASFKECKPKAAELTKCSDSLQIAESALDQANADLATSKVNQKACRECAVCRECEKCEQCEQCEKCEQCPNSGVDKLADCQADVSRLSKQLDQLETTLDQTHKDYEKVINQTNQGMQELLDKQQQQGTPQQIHDKFYQQYLEYQNDLASTPDPLLRLVISTKFILKAGVLPPSLAVVFDDQTADPVNPSVSKIPKALYIALRLIPWFVLAFVIGIQFFVFQLMVPYPVLSRLLIIILWLGVVGYAMLSHMYVLGLALFADAFVAFIAIFIPGVMLRLRQDKHSYTIA